MDGYETLRVWLVNRDADDDSARWLHFGGVVWVCSKSQKGRRRERESRGGDGKKMRSWSVPFPKVICTSDPRLQGGSATCLNHQLFTKNGLCSVYVSYCAMMRVHSEGWRDGGTEEVRGYGAVEEWLRTVELRDESRTGILFCQLECANGNVRAPGKLMNLIGEMPPLLPNAWSIAVVFSGRWYFSLLFFDCFFHLAWLFAVKSLMVNFESRK